MAHIMKLAVSFYIGVFVGAVFLISNPIMPDSARVLQPSHAALPISLITMIFVYVMISVFVGTADE
jgi:hypothetical protein